VFTGTGGAPQATYHPEMHALRGYYAILDLVDPPDAGGGEAGDATVTAALARAGRLLAARPCALQIRGKRWPAAALRDLARALLPAVRAAGVPLCVNDRLDVALASGADMVHLGQDDLPLGEARRIAAGRLAIGVSTHDPAQAAAAAAGGADYIGYGPVFATASKANPDPLVGLEGLRLAAASVAVPVVAIGGITVERAVAVAAAGAAAAALIAAIDRAPDPTAAGIAVNAAFGM
jgi:thiamine-phosphate pyrophosphorylase